ncbi:unnamed protein product [Lepidochelys kempii]
MWRAAQKTLIALLCISTVVCAAKDTCLWCSRDRWMARLTFSMTGICSREDLAAGGQNSGWGATISTCKRLLEPMSSVLISDFFDNSQFANYASFKIAGETEKNKLIRGILVASTAGKFLHVPNLSRQMEKPGKPERCKMFCDRSQIHPTPVT